MFPVKIAKLSPTQLRKVKKGEKVRIKSGSHSTVHLTPIQFKGFEKNKKLGKAYTVILPSHQGAGILGELANFVHPAAGVIAKSLGLGMKSGAGKYYNATEKQKLALIKARSMKKPVIKKEKKPRKTATEAQLAALVKARANKKNKIGKGFLSSIAKTLLPLAVNAGVDFAGNKIKETAKNYAGSGVRRRKFRGSALMPAGY